METRPLEERDRRIISKIADSLPARLFDSHAHLYRKNDLGEIDPDSIAGTGPGEVHVNTWRESVGTMVGAERLTGALFMPFPSAGCDIESSNRYLVSELASEPDSRGLMLVTPDTTDEHIEEMLESETLIGFKPYHTYSSHTPTFDSHIRDFLTDRLLSIAHERRLVVVLHIVRDGALADPENREEIRRICTRYPGVRLVLAHAGRGFHPGHTIDHAGSLRDLTNLWFDTSGICEPGAILALIEAFGTRKIMWGTDFPVSNIRGRSIGLGEGFFWLTEEHLQAPGSPGTTGKPVPVGLESLVAFLQALDLASLNGSDREMIFHDNAARFFGVETGYGSTTEELYRHASERIPGGVQLLSKKPEMLAPGIWPAYFSEARGCETWDLDGRHFYDMGTNGIGSCLLGFNDPDVSRAVKRTITTGSMSTLNPAEEVALADRLCEIHPWAQRVRFARTGGETAAMAVRIARATTDRTHVAVCGYHGWHDWYLAANLGDGDALRGHLFPGLDPLGVPRELRGTTHPFAYGDLDSLDAIARNHGSDLAAIVMEPCRYHDPAPGFLEAVKAISRKTGAALIFDEITIGFRLCFGGAHLALGVEPDIAIFAKALGNGHPIGAVIGTREAMEGAHRSFISSTFNTERVGPAAALATLDKLQSIDVPGHISGVGSRIMQFWKLHGEKHDLPVVTGEGYPCLAKFRFEHPEGRALMTLYTQLMVERGFLCGGVIYPTLAHTDPVVDLYGETIDEVFGEIAGIIDSGIAGAMRGPVAQEGFRRLL